MPSTLYRQEMAMSQSLRPLLSSAFSGFRYGQNWGKVVDIAVFQKTLEM
jgi:hypothetical protein